MDTLPYSQTSGESAVSSTESGAAGMCSECSPDVKTLRDGPDDISTVGHVKCFMTNLLLQGKNSEAGVKKQ